MGYNLHVVRPMKLDVDKIGSVASFLCAIHCGLSGLALGLLSSVGLAFIGDPITEIVFISTALLLGIWAVWAGYQKHHSWRPALIFASGIILIVVSHLMTESVDHKGVNLLAVGLSIAAGCTLVAFHLVNRRLIKSCSV